MQQFSDSYLRREFMDEFVQDLRQQLPTLDIPYEKFRQSENVQVIPGMLRDDGSYFRGHTARAAAPGGDEGGMDRLIIMAIEKMMRNNEFDMYEDAPSDMAIEAGYNDIGGR